MLVEARDLWFAYTQGCYVLRGASLAAERGEVVAVVGPTGCGKTTLLLLLAGLLKPERGVVLLDGRPLHQQLPEARRRIGLLLQNPDDQLFNPTVYDEIAYALRTMGLPEEAVEERVRDTAERLGLTSLLDKPPYKLSMGQKRLVALASILVYQPDILLLDEPTTFLDAHGVELVEHVLEEQRSHGLAIVATHDLDLVLSHADKACRLRNGRLECMTPARLLEEELEKPTTPVPRSLRILATTCLGTPAETAKKLREHTRSKP